MYGAREIATQFSFQDCSGHFGTTRYNWGEKKNGFLAPKRRQMKHLDCVLLLVRDQGVGGSNPLSPTISFSRLFSNLPAFTRFTSILFSLHSVGRARRISRIREVRADRKKVQAVFDAVVGLRVSPGLADGNWRCAAFAMNCSSTPLPRCFNF